MILIRLYRGSYAFPTSLVLVLVCMFFCMLVTRLVSNQEGSSTYSDPFVNSDAQSESKSQESSGMKSDSSREQNLNIKNFSLYNKKFETDYRQPQIAARRTTVDHKKNK